MYPWKRDMKGVQIVGVPTPRRATHAPKASTPRRPRPRPRWTNLNPVMPRRETFLALAYPPDDDIGNPSDPPISLTSLLHDVATGQVSVAAAASYLEDRQAGLQQVGDFARLDTWRARRNGFPEAIWGPGKTPEQIAALLDRLRETEPVALATRITPDVYQSLKKLIPEIEYEPLARICLLRRRKGESYENFPSAGPPRAIVRGRLLVVAAGTADLPVAEECRVVAQVMGADVSILADVGVAGLHRLLGSVERLREADVIVVVAGMDGALPSVVTGLVACPVISCPTSIGYGASLEGIAALLASLNACAPGLTVVNIDNGFGAAFAALRILRGAGNTVVHDDYTGGPSSS